MSLARWFRSETEIEKRAHGYFRALEHPERDGGTYPVMVFQEKSGLSSHVLPDDADIDLYRERYGEGVLTSRY